MPSAHHDPATSYVLEPVDPIELTGDPPPPTISVVLGTNLAYEAVCQAAAAVVQDAGSLIRQFSTVTTAALAVATEKLMEAAAKQDATGVTNWSKAITDLTTNLTKVGEVFTALGKDAAGVQGMFVPGAQHAPPPKSARATGASWSSPSVEPEES